MFVFGSEVGSSRIKNGFSVKQNHIPQPPSRDKHIYTASLINCLKWITKITYPSGIRCPSKTWMPRLFPGVCLQRLRVELPAFLLADLADVSNTLLVAEVYIMATRKKNLPPPFEIKFFPFFGGLFWSHKGLLLKRETK